MANPNVILTTWPNVIAIAPKLAGTGPPDFTNVTIQNMFLQDAANLFQFSKYGTLTEEIQRYATAHKAYMAYLIGLGKGPIQNESIGGISVSYVPVAPRSLKPWTETQYGRRVLQIISQTIPRLRFSSPLNRAIYPNQ